ncbi:uncharacterized protein LOC113515636 isoform X2 [Galleria mellonella]|uniref:Uncharacterized protein LOC113515636 isoform X2 n=1 Tax=Galleria mellonella TaxID=7137 RepID=A0ABM3MCR5_GALME|nr:uncharacterized protein LOC113515636 isoform X2 [Galleria mellonella]
MSAKGLVTVTIPSVFVLIFFLNVISLNYSQNALINNNKQQNLCKIQTQILADHCIEYETTTKTVKDKIAILNKLNTRRNKVASGDIRSFPSSENMMKLEWSQALEISAQRWADQCVIQKSPDILDNCRDLENVFVGQNIATVHGDAPGLSLTALVDIWYMELLHANASIISSYVPSTQMGMSHYDYFTQLVWAESSHVGCGSVKYKQITEDGNKVVNKTINRLVCNFSPSGNIIHNAVYNKGTPCSRCLNDLVCDTEYEALCAASSQKAKVNIDVNISDVVQKIDRPGTVNVKNSTTTTLGDFIEDDDYFTPYNYFSRFLDVPRPTTASNVDNNSSCKDFVAVDDFVELLKIKLSKDPMFKELLLSASTQISDKTNTYTDASVAALVSRIYSKKEDITTIKSTESEHINSTLLADLVEAVIFRKGEFVTRNRRQVQYVNGNIKIIYNNKKKMPLKKVKNLHEIDYLSSDNYFVIKYNDLLKKIAQDLKVLKLNKMFHCSGNISLKKSFVIFIIFPSMVLIKNVFK